MITNHVKKQNKIKSTWKNKIDSNPEFSERKAKEVMRQNMFLEIVIYFSCEIEAAAQYFKRRLRILEITSDNSWGMARNTVK